MHLLELGDRHVGINLRRSQIRMPQHLLDVAEIGSSLQHQGGHLVPEQVTGSFLVYVGGVHVLLDHGAQVVG